tara:strand:- start:51565 stop:51723 length:159 start_codon:yes stop_codon:yes gene_type:complete
MAYRQIFKAHFFTHNVQIQHVLPDGNICGGVAIFVHIFTEKSNRRISPSGAY